MTTPIGPDAQADAPPSGAVGPGAPDATRLTPGLVRGLVRSARPRQWSKNVLVFAAPAAAGVLDEPRAVVETGVAFVAFCFAASGTYLVNDVMDVEADRRHPTKCHRPIAAGSVPLGLARVVGLVLLGAGVGVSFVAAWELAAIVAGYVVLTLAYSIRLKHEPVIDLATIASGFVLRTIAGGLAVGVAISAWFLIVAGAGSLFMVAGKRSAEHLELGDGASGHRRSLAESPRTFLVYVRATASSVVILGYCLWAFERAEIASAPVWYELSIVPFVLGLLRYALLLEQGRGGAPEDLVLGDRTLQAFGVLWAATFGLAVYAS